MMTGIKTAYDENMRRCLFHGALWIRMRRRMIRADRLWEKSFLNRKYFSNLRIEKLDAETGEPILHDDAVFGVYRAERNETDDGDGAVRCYTADTMILEASIFLRRWGQRRSSHLRERQPGPESFSMERSLPEHRFARRKI